MQADERVSDGARVVLTVLARYDQPIGQTVPDVAELLASAPLPVGQTVTEIGALLTDLIRRGLADAVISDPTDPLRFQITEAGRLALA